MNLPICEHIKPGGAPCGSPALRDHKYCYYHMGLRKAVPTATMFVRANPYRKDGDDYAIFDLPFLEDAAAIQIGFMQLIQAVAWEEIDARRAKLILSALHGAAANLRKMDAVLAKCEAAKKEDNVDRGEVAESRSSQEMAGTGHPNNVDGAGAAEGHPSPKAATTGDLSLDDIAPASGMPAAKKQPTSVQAGSETKKRTG